MDLQRVRVVLLISLSFFGIMLYSAWDQEHRIPEAAASVTASAHPNAGAVITGQADVPSIVQPQQAPMDIESPLDFNNIVSVKTETLELKIDRQGGDIVYAALLDYPITLEPDSDAFVLLDSTQARSYVAQSGLIGTNTPDSQADGRALYDQYEVLEHPDGSVAVKLMWSDRTAGIDVVKHFQIPSHGYLINVSYRVDNHGDKPWTATPYHQIKRSPTPIKKSGMIGLPTYQGAAYSTADKRYQKISFDKMKDRPSNQSTDMGWVAMVEHYFLSAWVPEAGQGIKIFSRTDGNNQFYIGYVGDPMVVAARSSEGLSTQLYMGPEVTDELRLIAPGLDLTVDYGILWPISQLLFWLLKNSFEVLGNWGWSILAVTLMVKLAFYRLSAASYRSMGNMRRLQPQLNALKEECGEDKQRFSQEMMTLYRREKINPLGGCLPILVQIPVFIALYYVLLESVELRHAPFILWITDLSNHDPYYVLPVLMGGSMLLQQRLNPAPPDPVQARIMMLMPIVFTVLFMNFPAGLVLYWFANNLLSMTQQWYIMRRIQGA